MCAANGKLDISIGGIGFSVSCRDRIEPDKCLMRFVRQEGVKKAPHCKLAIVGKQAQLDVPDLRGRGRTVFEAKTTWGLYKGQMTGKGRRKAELIMTVPSLKGGRQPQLSVDFDKDFKNGRAYVGGAGMQYFLYPFLEALMINLLGKGRGALLHACCVDDNGKGYLFVGRSGAGKSTMANLWNGMEGARVLSDDRVILQNSRSGTRNSRLSLRAFGTPWHGTEDYALNSSVHVDKIFFIKHSRRNNLAPVSGTKPVSELVRNSFLPFWDREGLEYSVGFLSRIARKGDLHDLGFMPGEEVVDFVRSI